MDDLTIKNGKCPDCGVKITNEKSTKKFLECQ